MSAYNTGISPVLEAFIQGQKLQTGTQEAAKERELRQQQIDATLKEIENRHKEAQGAHDLAIEHFGLALKTARSEERQRQIQNLTNNPALAPGTTNFQQPDMRMAIPGVQGDQMVPRSSMGLPSSSQVTPAPGTPITMDTEFGPMGMNMPGSNIDITRQLAAAKAEGELPSEMKKLDSQNNKALAVATIKADYEHELGLMKEKSAIYGADARVAAELEKERNKFNMTMFQNFGPEAGALAMGGPEGMAREIARHSARVGQGYEDITDVPSIIQGGVKTFMSQNGITTPSGGSKKFRMNLTGVANQGERVLNAFDDFDSQFPASKNTAGKLGNAAANLPLVNKFTDIGQASNLYGANIASLATITGETPGMMRSPLLAQKAMALAPSPTDSPKTRLNKKIDTLDIIFTNVDKGISSLGKVDRQEYWKSVIDEMPTIKRNYAFKDVLENILRTGNYDSTMLNRLKAK